MPFGGLLTVGIIGAAGGLGGAAIGSRAAGKAADTQAAAANRAADLQKQAADDALAFNREVFNTQQQNMSPWLQVGQNAILSLRDMLNPGGALSEPWGREFTAPSAADMQTDPGWQFRMREGQKALERSAAARGGILSGGTLKAINRFGQDFASNEYANVYGRAKDAYQMAYNQFQQQQADRFNRFASLAGIGQTAAGQLNSAAGQAAGQNANILMSAAEGIGNSQQNAAAARASGYAAGGNLWGSALGNIGNNIGTLLTLRQLGLGGGNASSFGVPWSMMPEADNG